MDFNVKQAIIDRLTATKRVNRIALYNYMLKNGFYTRRCHRHHKYAGGLADHAWQTYQIAWRLNAENRAKNPNAPILDDDSIAIAALLHDFCDCSGLHNIKGHGRRSAKMLKEIGFVLTEEEFLAIRFHMSLRGKENHPLYEDAKRSQLRYLIHQADGLSARLHNGYDDPDQYLIDNSWDDDECKETDEFAQIVYNRLNNIDMDNNVNEQEIATTNIYNREYTPDMIRNLAENEIFVFGSNIYGSHGGGAARFAYDHFGAEWGVGEGLTGRTYAIPTMEGGVDYIRGKVNTFLEFARNNQDKKFLVTPIACGIAGFRKREIAPLFADALTMENVILPEDFVSILCNRN